MIIMRKGRRGIGIIMRRRSMFLLLPSSSFIYIFIANNISLVAATFSYALLCL